MSWLPWPLIPKKRWPKLRFKQKRAITLLEHQAIVARELNPERKAFYELAWHLGACQTDVALLEAGNIDWEKHVVSYARKKNRRTGLRPFRRAGGQDPSEPANRRAFVSLFAQGSGSRSRD